MASLRDDVIGFVIIGDLNIHHKPWLRFSDANTPEEVLLKQISDYALRQVVTESTRILILASFA